MLVAAVAVVVMMVVGAALGIKRRFDRRKPRAETAQHILDDVIAADAQPLAYELDVDVTIADMPGEPRQIVSSGGADFDQRLGPADHPDDGAVFEHKAVAVPQRGGVRKIEQEFRAALAAQHHAPAVALVRIKLDRIDGALLIPMSGGFDVARVLHGWLGFTPIELRSGSHG
jgi:hypothetical protein